MTAKLATVFGGSGFIGRYLVQRLARAGWQIRIPARRPDSALFLKPLGDVGQIVPMAANIRDEISVRRAVDCQLFTQPSFWSKTEQILLIWLGAEAHAESASSEETAKTRLKLYAHTGEDLGANHKGNLSPIVNECGRRFPVLLCYEGDLIGRFIDNRRAFMPPQLKSRPDRTLF